MAPCKSTVPKDFTVYIHLQPETRYYEILLSELRSEKWGLVSRP